MQRYSSTTAVTVELCLPVIFVQGQGRSGRGPPHRLHLLKQKQVQLLCRHPQLHLLNDKQEVFHATFCVICVLRFQFFIILG